MDKKLCMFLPAPVLGGFQVNSFPLFWDLVPSSPVPEMRKVVLFFKDKNSLLFEGLLNGKKAGIEVFRMFAVATYWGKEGVDWLNSSLSQKEEDFLLKLLIPIKLGAQNSWQFFTLTANFKSLFWKIKTRFILVTGDEFALREGGALYCREDHDVLEKVWIHYLILSSGNSSRKSRSQKSTKIWSQKPNTLTKRLD